MATTKPKARSDSAPGSKKDAPIFTPTPEARSSANSKRLIAIILWIVAIALEAVAIFWLLRPPFDELAENQGFPQWRFYALIGAFVVIGALSITGSFLWKKANRLDPASRKEPVRFFVQNQLGAIIALIAFVPLVILVFLNKDMDGKQKGIAGGVGVAIALAAVLLGIDFKPLSQEQAAVESQVVIQLVGEDSVWWSEGGKVVHLCEQASDIKNASTPIHNTTIADALAEGKEGITLKLDTELNQCGLPIPENLADIEAWVREARGK
ncbi:MAG: hypothetical protein LBH11_01175 [Propionibacteriaceae bacterium]|jgi:uncharacterized membrane protein|nr:hypothetical protein [Propionibacteriaceae bacterium]